MKFFSFLQRLFHLSLELMLILFTFTLHMFTYDIYYNMNEKKRKIKNLRLNSNTCLRSAIKRKLYENERRNRKMRESIKRSEIPMIITSFICCLMMKMRIFLSLSLLALYRTKSNDLRLNVGANCTNSFQSCLLFVKCRRKKIQFYTHFYQFACIRCKKN